MDNNYMLQLKARLEDSLPKPTSKRSVVVRRTADIKTWGWENLILEENERTQSCWQVWELVCWSCHKQNWCLLAQQISIRELTDQFWLQDRQTLQKLEVHHTLFLFYIVPAWNKVIILKNNHSTLLCFHSSKCTPLFLKAICELCAKCDVQF